jgi:hypothetical protein
MFPKSSLFITSYPFYREQRANGSLFGEDIRPLVLGDTESSDSN